MKGSALIAQGGFGCVFYPPVKCNEYNTKDYISKIQIESEQSENEIILGKMIENIPDYKFHFAPTVEKCNLNISKAELKGEKRCKIFKTKKQEKFINLIMPYINGGAFGDFIAFNANPKLTLLVIINSFSHLLKSFTILQSNSICHFDIKSDNILIDETTNLPIIIDFGLSIFIPDIKNFKKYFYNYFPSYYIWPPEVHYINFLLHKKDQPTLTDIENLCETFTKHAFHGRFSPLFIEKYKVSCRDFLKQFLGRDSSEVILEIITFWSTWDIFALCFMYLDFFIKIADGSEFVTGISELLMQNINPDPTKRLDIKQTATRFNQFKNNQKYDEIVKKFALLRT